MWLANSEMRNKLALSQLQFVVRADLATGRRFPLAFLDCFGRMARLILMEDHGTRRAGRFADNGPV